LKDFFVLGYRHLGHLFVINLFSLLLVSPFLLYVYFWNSPVWDYMLPTFWAKVGFGALLFFLLFPPQFYASTAWIRDVIKREEEPAPEVPYSRFFSYLFRFAPISYLHFLVLLVIAGGFAGSIFWASLLAKSASRIVRIVGVFPAVFWFWILVAFLCVTTLFVPLYIRGNSIKLSFKAGLVAFFKKPFSMMAITLAWLLWLVVLPLIGITVMLYFSGASLMWEIAARSFLKSVEGGG